MIRFLGGMTERPEESYHRSPIVMSSQDNSRQTLDFEDV
jgi:hypothetical protein